MAEFNFIRADADQIYLLPPDARDWLPSGHLAWQVQAAVAQMDLSGFLRAYRRDGQGAAAYHPAVMVGSLLYCYCKGVRSSRAIEAASYDDVGVRVLLGNHHPDHATIARFVERHHQQMKPLFVQVLVQCARAGLVTVDVVAGDGTRVKANASMQANATVEDLDIDIATLQTLLDGEVDKWFAQHQQQDAADDALFGDDDDGPDDDGSGRATPSSLYRLVETIARRHAARAKLAEQDEAHRRAAEAEHAQQVAKAEAAVASRQQHYQAQYEGQQSKVNAYRQRRADKQAAGHAAAPVGPPPIAPEQHSKVIRAATRLARARTRLADVQVKGPATDKPLKINTTDPSSRVMRGKHGEYLQFHNIQVMANPRQIILSIRRHDNPADVAALHPNLDAARANLDAAGITDPITAALFDAGYASGDNFTTACQPTLYVAVTKEARQTGRRNDPAPKKVRSWTQMADRLATEPGQTLYKRRAAIIEPIFGQLFQRLGRHLNYRDDKADPELHLWGATHNLLKLFRHQTQRPAQETT